MAEIRMVKLKFSCFVYKNCTSQKTVPQISRAHWQHTEFRFQGTMFFMWSPCWGKLLRKLINGHYHFERILGIFLPSLDTDDRENGLYSTVTCKVIFESTTQFKIRTSSDFYSYIVDNGAISYLIASDTIMHYDVISDQLSNWLHSSLLYQLCYRAWYGTLVQIQVGS